MESRPCIQGVLFVGVILFCAACQGRNLVGERLDADPQNRLVLAPPTASLPAVTDRLDAVTAYHVTLRRAIRQTQLAGSILPSTVEYNYTWRQTDEAVGYDVHTVTTVTDPLSGESVVMDEGYLVGDRAFLYCPACPLPADQAGWTVTKRSESPIREFTLDIDDVSRMTGLPLARLMAQSLVIGDENIGGISATHYQLTDIQVLSDTVRTVIGGASSTPLEVSLATFDLWLTVGDQQTVQYTLQAAGKSEYGAGSLVLFPFTLQEQYLVTAIDHEMTITVPTAVLNAVAAPLQVLADQP